MGIDITYTLGSRGIARLKSLDSKLDTATALRPTIDQPLTIKNETDTVTLFDGTILSVTDRALADPNRGVVTEISAVDVSRALDSRLITKTYVAGQTLKAIVTDLVTYLTPFGITLDAGMATGPTMGLITLDTATIGAALNHLSDLTGWVWRIQPTKVLQMASVGTWVAPYSLTSSNSKVLGGVQWSKTRGKFVNRVYVKYGPDMVVRKLDTFTATASQSVFTLNYPALAYSGVVNVGGTVSADGQDAVGGTNETADYTGAGSGATWEFNLTAGTMTRTTGLSVGTFVIAFYPVQYPLTTSSEDSASVTALGPWEEVIAAPDIFDKTAAQTLAAALLRRYKAVPRQLTIRTREGMVFPGDTITLTLPERTVSGAWLITGVNIRTDVDRKFTYTLTCLEGTEAQESWVEYFRSVFGGTTTRGASGTVTGTGAALTGRFMSTVKASVDMEQTAETGLISASAGVVSVAGPGIDLDSPADPMRWSMIASRAMLGSKRGLYFKDRTAGEVPLVLWHSDNLSSGGEYSLSPHATTGATHQCDLGDLVQHASNSRWNKLYVKTVDASIAVNVSDGTRTAVVKPDATEGVIVGSLTNHTLAVWQNSLVRGTVDTSGNLKWKYPIFERDRTVAMGAWTTFTPTWTNLTVGNGTLTAKYSQHGKTFTFFILLVFGTTTTVSGSVSVTLPLTVTAYAAAVSFVQSMLYDSGTGNRYVGRGYLTSGTTVALVTNASPTTAVNATVPFTFGDGAQLYLTGTAEEA